MADKYTQVVDANWDDRVLFAESIPHLFHQDLLYLWMLERDLDRRSRAWHDRIDGWRHLAALFFLGELSVAEESIRKPFLHYTRPFGIENVSWLIARGSTDRLGVLSPTVLVRPMPDFSQEVLIRWRQTFTDLGRRQDETRHFVDLAITRLTEGESNDRFSYRKRLATVLEREFGRGRLASHPAGRHVIVPVLRGLGWARPRLEAEGPVQLSLLIREGSQQEARVYVPRCKYCSELLTRTREEAPVEVYGPTFQVECSNRHANELSLADFLIWYRDETAVIVWQYEQQIMTAPPTRLVEGIQIIMEWNPGHVADDRRRFLSVLFPERVIRQHRMDDMFFETVIVPGTLEGFRGLPIRSDWIDVLQEPDRILPEVDPSRSKVVYRDLRLRGWPEPITRNFGGMSLAMRPDLALGLYPDPRKVGPDWKWFRVFLDGPGRREHSVTCKDAVSVLPWLSEVKSGAPQFIVIESLVAPYSGVVFHTGPPANPPEGLPTAEARIGVDFGTSNTLIAFYNIDRGGDRGQSETLRPEDLLLSAHWLASPVTTWEGAAGDLLPRQGYRCATDDPHLVPSALWMLPGQLPRYLIRWDNREPLPGALPLACFKLDTGGGSFLHERHAYLREILLHTLPAVISPLARTRRITAVSLGFAFPLAFNHEARRGMRELLEVALRNDLQELTGLGVQFQHLNESAACVRAFGTPKYGDTYLVADMGGGTLDLVLFEARTGGKIEIHQMGSLRFAGEDFIHAVAKRKTGTDASEQLVWNLRDSIAEGRASNLYRDDSDTKRTLDRLVVFAFEFLRSMVLAHRKSHKNKKIRLVLVGNGWHLADAFLVRAKDIGARDFFFEFYRDYIRRMGDPGITLYDEGPMQELISSKHLIVRGALANTIKNPQRELQESANPSKLPAGRVMIFKPPGHAPIRISWERIIGKDSSVALADVPRRHLEKSYLDFELDRMPPLRDSWHTELIGTFGTSDIASIPYPTVEHLRDSIEIDSDRIERGPLQVILEGRWREELSR